MNQYQKEAYEAIQKIDEELYNKFCENDWNLEEIPQLSLVLAGHMFFINLSISNCEEFHLYNSENDDRAYYQETDSYEDFYHFIKRKWNNIKSLINEVEL